MRPIDPPERAASTSRALWGKCLELGRRSSEVSSRAQLRSRLELSRALTAPSIAILLPSR
ncbi:hypothetical protein HQ37_04475 [Porphyromonas sp. COT-239 OH1446]|nr:hypothetical protein HQ37_04475 [Porphyromonas sp. COT-239 OH1446]